MRYGLNDAERFSFNPFSYPYGVGDSLELFGMRRSLRCIGVRRVSTSETKCSRFKTCAKKQGS